MRKIFMTAVAAVVIFLTALMGTQMASAVPIPPEANGYKFWSPSICVEPGSGIPDAIASQTTYRLAYLAQQWNNKVPELALDYSTDCAADGYPASRRMVVGLFNNPDYAYCTYSVNSEYNVVNGYRRWTNGPGIYINTAIYGCVANQNRRDHIVSMVIGQKLGLTLLNSTGYNSRVMNQTPWSYDNVPLPDTNSGNLLNSIYLHAYCQPFGSVC